MRVGSHIYQQRDEDEEVGAIIDCVFDKSSFNLANSRESPRPSIRLHERQQQPAYTHRSHCTKKIFVLRTKDGTHIEVRESVGLCVSVVKSYQVRNWEVQ